MFHPLKFRVMKKFNSIESFAREINKGTFGIYVATLTPKSMNKYLRDVPRAGQQPNPYEGRVETLCIMQNAATGVNYYNAVKGECEREGIKFTKEEFEQAFPKEKTYAESVDDELSNIIMENRVSGQRYLRLYTGRKPTKSFYFTMLDGNIIDEDSAEYKSIEGYFKPSSKSAKQEALGIANIVGVKQPKVENVLFMKQGDKLWCNKDRNISEKVVDEMLKVFSK